GGPFIACHLSQRPRCLFAADRKCPRYCAIVPPEAHLQQAFFFAPPAVSCAQQEDPVLRIQTHGRRPWISSFGMHVSPMRPALARRTSASTRGGSSRSRLTSPPRGERSTSRGASSPLA